MALKVHIQDWRKVCKPGEAGWVGWNSWRIKTSRRWKNVNCTLCLNRRASKKKDSR